MNLLWLLDQLTLLENSTLFEEFLNPMPVQRSSIFKLNKPFIEQSVTSKKLLSFIKTRHFLTKSKFFAIRHVSLLLEKPKNRNMTIHQPLSRHHQHKKRKLHCMFKILIIILNHIFSPFLCVWITEKSFFMETKYFSFWAYHFMKYCQVNRVFITLLLPFVLKHLGVNNILC